MAKITLYTKNFTAPAQITRELYSNVGSGINYLGDVLRAFKGSTDFEIWDSPSGGTQLTEGVDYDLKNQDTKMSSEAGYPVYTGYQITNATYQTGNVYFTYKVIMSALDADYFNSERERLDTQQNRIDILDQIGMVYPWPFDVLPASNYQWARGGSLVRVDYPILYSRAFTSKGTCTISNGTPAIVTLNSHGLLTGSCISFTTTGALPTGLSIDTMYFVVYNDSNSFWVASSLANAIAGTKLATSSAGSGVHTTVYNPWGFADSTHFYLPDTQAVVMKGLAPAAGRTVGGNLKYTYGLGASKEDQGQRIQATTKFATDLGLFTGAFYHGGPIAGTCAAAGGANDDILGFDSALVARTGTTTEDNHIVMNFIIRTN